MFQFKYASDVHWSGKLSKIIKEDFDFTLAEKCHELITFISGYFTGSQCQWYSPENEGSERFYSTERLEYLFM